MSIARCDLTKLDSHKNYRVDLHENFTGDMSVNEKNWLNFESRPHQDQYSAIFSSILRHREMGNFPTIWRISLAKKNGRILMKILAHMYRVFGQGSLR